MQRSRTDIGDAILLCESRKLGDFLHRYGLLLKRRVGYVRWFRDIIDNFQIYLADEIRNKSEGDKTLNGWVLDGRFIVYEAMDLLDNFSLQVNRNNLSSKAGILNSLKRCLCLWDPEATLIDDTVVELTLLKDKLRKIYREKIGRHYYPGLGKRLTMTSSQVEGDDSIVGFEDEFYTIQNLILQKEHRRCVVWLCGMGGLGKTSLARKLYNSCVIRDDFDCRIWVRIPQGCDIKEVLIRIVKSFGKLNREEEACVCTWDEDDIFRYIKHQCIKGKRYLVVIDDLWAGHLWLDKLSKFFPSLNNGSRVIITSRNRIFTMEATDRVFVHQLRFLTEEESWNLFCKEALPPSGGVVWSDDMAKLGKEMVAMCGGLPLAISTLGNLLRQKIGLSEWYTAKERIWQQLGKVFVEIPQVFSSSYHDLSSNLKLCFLYLGIFPSDYVINAGTLYRLWIGERFIPQGEKGASMEDVAEEYLMALEHRSLIQVTQWDEGEIVAFKVHNLLRDRIVEKAREWQIFDIFDPRKLKGDGTYPSSAEGRCRRLAIHSRVSDFFMLDHSNSKLHSLVVFNTDGESLEDNHLEIICENFKSLRVLDMQRVTTSIKGQIPLPMSWNDNMLHLNLLWLPGEEHAPQMPKELSPDVNDKLHLYTFD